MTGVSERRRLAVFVGLAAAVYAVAVWTARAHVGASNAVAVGLGAACDLAVTVPALFYLLLVRQGMASWMTLAMVSVAGARLAGWLLPANEQALLPPVQWLGVPLEILAVTAIVRSVRRGSGLPARYRWAVDLLAAELSVFRYALFSWRERPDVPEGSQAFRTAEASGYGMFAAMLMAAVALEGFPLHFLLARWSVTAAWVFTGMSGYALLWTVALYRSLVLRPTLVSDAGVVLRIGFLWRAEIQRDQIVRVRAFSAGESLRGAGDISLAVINDPVWVLELGEPVTVHGPLGRRKAVERIGVAVDDGEGFRAAVLGEGRCGCQRCTGR